LRVHTSHSRSHFTPHSHKNYSVIDTFRVLFLRTQLDEKFVVPLFASTKDANSWSSKIQYTNPSCWWVCFSKEVKSPDCLSNRFSGLKKIFYFETWSVPLFTFDKINNENWSRNVSWVYTQRWGELYQQHNMYRREFIETWNGSRGIQPASFFHSVTYVVDLKKSISIYNAWNRH
jgi:hypothetical protein